MGTVVKINGVTVYGSGSGSSAITIPLTNNKSFTLSWSGMSPSANQCYVNLYLTNYQACLSFSGNTGVSPFYSLYLDSVGNMDQSAYAGYMLTGASGSITVNSTVSLVGLTLHSDGYNTDSDQYPYSGPDVTFSAAATAPSWASGAYFRIANTISTGNVSCTWAGAQAGTNNPIASFEYRYSDNNGSSWSNPVTINSTAASGSASLPTSGTVNTTRIYQLRIKGSASSNQYSGWLSGNQGCKRIITLTAPVLSLTSPSNQLVWKVATGSTITGSSSGTVTYELLKSGSATGSSTTTVNANVTLAESAISTWGTSPLSMTIRASCTINGYTATAISATVAFTYRPTFTDASNFLGSAADGQSLTLTWTAGSLYNGDTVNHLLEYSADGTTFTQLSASAASPYAVSEAVILALTTTPNTGITFRLTASGDGQTGTPLTVAFTYYPTVNPITNLRINGMASASGESFTVTWDASTASNGDPANRYQIVIDGQVYGLVYTTSFEITAAMAYQLGSGTVTVMAQLVSGQNTYSATDGGLSVSFTYRLNFKPISVYDGTAMIACVADYYDGTSWVSLDWSIWDGEEWK